ncbi:AraC family transcriptional regulator [Paenibacillus ginsengarvi]|uniref:AraC family transcriptional regulator n=1 Tax=Paenibacillus ginsengarvi TaxID=400777 RepID=A0A3B0C4V6_9BACL|nr:AraC family transcriptional regulator [Paenibacillus ginsengarvi]
MSAIRNIRRYRDVQNWGDLPEAPIRLEHLDAGYGEIHDGWVHTKTVPFGIIAQAVEGTYIVRTPRGLITASDGEVFITPPNMPLEITHRCRPDTKRMMIRFAHFRFSFMGAVDLFDLYDPTGSSDRQAGLVYGDLIQRMLDIKAQEQGLSFPNWAHKSMLAFRLLGLVLDSSVPREGYETRLAQLQQIQPLLTFIVQHIGQPLDIATLLSHCNYSRSALFSLFRSAFGQTPMEYVKSQRLGAAFRKLITTSLPVAEIAGETGFANSFHFSREFKARFHKTPTEVRKENGIWREKTAGYPRG